VNGYDLVYRWFDVLKANNHLVLGYVIMPNHLHAMIAFRQTTTSINTIIGNGKRFMAYDIIKRLESACEFDTLSMLSASVETHRRANEKKHDVWELSFDWKHCTDAAFMKQKLDYYHLNPCKGKWMLAPTPVDYPHSSAYFCFTGRQGHYPVTNFLEVADLYF
jgi:REP element-mobilizing transposase RayT